MENREEWCADKLSKLLNEDLRISTLTEIKDHFTIASHREATKTAELLELPLVFDCLNDSNKEQVDLACEVLTMCLEKLDIVETTTRYSVPLERALTHPNFEVKLMALEEIKRVIKVTGDRKEHLVSELTRRTLFSNIIRCIGDSTLLVASAASDIVLGFATVNVDCILTPESVRAITETMSINEVVRLRFYELFINICILSEKSHQKIIATGFLSPMLQEISTSRDVLLCVNIIELMNNLVECNHGYNYLESEGVIKTLFGMLNNVENQIFINLCEPGVCKLFGHMAHHKPNETFLNYPDMVDRIFENVQCGNPTLVKVSLETIAYVASINKVALDSLASGKMISTIIYISNKLQSLPTKEKLICLAWLEDLLKFPEELDTKASHVAQKWFSAFGTEPMALVMHYVRNPFEELRLAGLGVLQSMSDHRWGQESIENFPGLIEYLLDRSAETSKMAKDLKYSIVENLYRKNFGIFSNTVMSQFETFLKQGPHYVHVVTEVAIEGNE